MAQYLPERVFPVLSTDDLGEAFEPEMRFENPDGTPIIFDTDFFGDKAGQRIAGPFIDSAWYHDRNIAR